MNANSTQPQTYRVILRQSTSVRRPSRRSGFTLVELLVVIALTSILMTLIFRPLTEGVNLTSRASTQIEAQTSARTVIGDLQKSLQSATFVYDNAQTPINVWLPRQGGGQSAVSTLYSMLEYVQPSRQLDQLPSADTDPTTGTPLYGPDAASGASGYSLPLAPGRSLVRVFVGLLDNNSTAAGAPAGVRGIPVRPYLNKFEQPSRTAEDNRYVLYRAEITAYIKDPDVNGPNAKFVPNLGLFHTGASIDTITDKDTDPLILHDPNFFYDAGDAGDITSKGDLKWAVPGWKDLNGDGKVQYFENWRAVSALMVPREKTDMIALDRDENTNEPKFYLADGTPAPVNSPNALPKMRSLVSFAPGSVQNDPAAPGAIDNIGNETPVSAAAVFTTQYTNWATPYRIQAFRNLAEFKDPTNNPNNLDPAQDPLTIRPNLSYYQYLPQPPGSPTPYHLVRVDTPPGNNPPTLAQLANLPDVGPNADPVTGFWRNLRPQFALTVDAKRGLINFGFPHSVVVNNGQKPLSCYYSPAEINNGMSPAPQVGIFAAGKRYLDLRTLPNSVWDNVTLNPAGLRSPLDLLAVTKDRVPLVQIVPGTERVFGPDQRPGLNYGSRVQYNRVSSSSDLIGKNEYRINYTDVPNINVAALDEADPRVRMGYIEFDSIPEGSNEDLPNLSPNLEGNALRQEDPSGLATGARVYREHGLPNLREDRDVNGNVVGNRPAVPVEVTYNFQMNRASDVLKADYMTRELMNVSLEMRLYDPRSSRPQTMNLASKIKVRNLQK